MSKIFNDVLAGLNEALEYAKGNVTEAVVHEIEPLDIKAIRVQVGMTQPEFARAVGVKLPTLRHWEQGDRCPSGSALVLLNLIACHPQKVIAMIGTC